MLTESTLVRDATEFLRLDPMRVDEEDAAADVARQFASHPDARVIYVVDRANRLRGAIPASEVPSGTPRAVEAEFNEDGEIFPERVTDTVARDIMRPAVQVVMDEPLVDVLSKMYENEAEEIAVVDADGRLVASLDAVRVLSAWAHQV